MPTPNSGESEQDFVSRCIPIVLHDGTAEDQSQAAAICYSIFRREAIHPDFQRILNLFFRQYPKQALEKFTRFIQRNNLNVSKSYNPQTQFRESFEWIEPLIQPYKSDRQAKYYLIRALTANISMNNNDYGPYPRLEDAAKTLSWRPVNIDHDHGQWLPYPRTRVDFSNANELSVEATLRVDNQDAWLQRMLDNGEILHPSIEGRPDPMGGYHFTGMALLRAGHELPGDPLTEILPLVFNESVGRSLCRLKDGKLVCESKKDSEVKYLKESMIKEAIKEVLKEQEDEQKCPEGEHWDAELKKCVPDKVTEQEGPVEMPETPEESPPETDTQPPVPHECETGFHWDDAKQQCVPDKAGASDDAPMTLIAPSGGAPHPATMVEQDVPHECPANYHWSNAEQNCVPNEVGDSTKTPMVAPGGSGVVVVTMTEQDVPPATNAPATVAQDDMAQCPSNFHWDQETETCVPDVMEECEIGWHFDLALQKCVPDEQATNEGKLRLGTARAQLLLIESRERFQNALDTINHLNKQISKANATRKILREQYIVMKSTLESRLSEYGKRLMVETKRADKAYAGQLKEAQAKIAVIKDNDALRRDNADQLATIEKQKTHVDNMSRQIKETFAEDERLSSELTEALNRETQWSKEKKKFQEDLTKAMKHQKYLYEFLKKHNFEIVDMPTN